MKKLLWKMFFVVTFCALSMVSASAVGEEPLKVGLRYGNTALFSANLENAVGSGYTFGYFDEHRNFEPLGWTNQRAISMTAAGDIYMSANGTYSNRPSDGGDSIGAWHVQVDGVRSFEEAQALAGKLGGYPAWMDFAYAVRVGSYHSRGEAEAAASRLGQGTAVRSSETGVLVTVTRSCQILFEFDASGVLNLGMRPDGSQQTATWFKGYKYPGAFEYPRTTGGNLNVLNVVDLEQYVKGVVPYEMSSSWPLAALEAQAVCARTYASRTTSHSRSHGFDVCSTTCCQVYHGLGSGGAAPSALSDRAVDNTRGERLYYQGELIQDAVYHSSDGGATEDVVNVWGSPRGYLLGKKDPYEAQISIPNYRWSTTYTAAELTWILGQKGYRVGTVERVYVSEYTPLGNVKKVTFEGSEGTKTVSGDTCRTIFYSSTYKKSARSIRFQINGEAPPANGGQSGGDLNGASGDIYINSGSNRVNGLEGLSVISGGGRKQTLDGGSYSVITSSGVTGLTTGGTPVRTFSNAASRDTFVLTGTGSGHNVGMSQYGAKAMAELGHSYEEILTFYYTDVTIQ